MSATLDTVYCILYTESKLLD